MAGTVYFLVCEKKISEIKRRLITRSTRAVDVHGITCDTKCTRRSCSKRGLIAGNVQICQCFDADGLKQCFLHFGGVTSRPVLIILCNALQESSTCISDWIWARRG